MTALITGASGGLGRAMAAECASRGYDLVLTDINEKGLDEIKQGLKRQYDAGVETIACDLTNKEQVGLLFTQIKEKNIKIDMFLGVAGLDNEGGFTERSSDQIFDIVNINIAATLRATHAALAQRDKAKWFGVVIVSSLASQYPMPLKATYAASKRFLYDFSIALGQELKAENVSVLALCPGGLATTKEALSGIEAQGFWGRATTVSLPKAAQKTISKLLKGQSVYIPGTVNNILSWLGKLVPKKFIAKMLLRRWHTARKKRMSIEV